MHGKVLLVLLLLSFGIKPFEGIRKICLLPRSSGQFLCSNSQGLSVRYYFNPKTGNCNAFEYFGCEGNDNNFLTKTTCIEECSKEDTTTFEITTKFITSTTTPPYTTTTPLLTTTTLTSTTSAPPPTTTTSSTTTQSIKTAEPSSTSTKNTCLQMPEKGNCDKRLTRYFFNPTTQTCQKFLYSGCEGNKNRFSDIYSCCRKCVSSKHLESCGVNMIEYKRSVLFTAYGSLQ